MTGQLSPESISRRFAGLNVTELEQPANGSETGPIASKNGNPNDAGDPASVGVGLSDFIFCGFYLKSLTDVEMTIRVWVKWKGSDQWVELIDSEFKVPEGRPSGEEMKTRGLSDIYFERVDGNGGDWRAFVMGLT